MQTNQTLDAKDTDQPESTLNTAENSVSSKGSVFTISGKVDSYSQKLEAEYDAKRVYGDNQLPIEYEK